MTADSRLARSVPFPEWAADFVLRFTTKDMIDLENFILGVDPSTDPASAAEHRYELMVRRLNTSWLGLTDRLINKNDVAFIREAIRLGLKRPGGMEHAAPSDAELDDLPFAPADTLQKIADALFCATTGKGYAALLQEREAARSNLAE